MSRLAIVTSHPIQYYAPWFRHLASHTDLRLRVYYLWDFGVEARTDRDFGTRFAWDIPLLDGYDWEFLSNRSADPGTHHFFGLRNPGLSKRVRAFDPDAVLMMGYRYVSMMQMLLTWDKSHGPLLFRGDSHRLVKSNGFREDVRRMAIRGVFSRFDAFLAVGSANRDYFRYHGVRRDRIFPCPHAIENERFTGAKAEARLEALAWREELGIPHDSPVVLFAGKFIDKKRPLDLLEAFQRAELENAWLLFVGDGPLKDEMDRRAKGDSRIVFAPFQNQSRMPVVYETGDVFVLPSAGLSETWGLAVNEAQCLQKPVIVSDHVGCARDLVRPGKNGLVFRAKDVDALAGCLEKALSDPERLARWGRNGRRLVERYSYATAARGLCRALNSLGVTCSVKDAE